MGGRDSDQGAEKKVGDLSDMFLPRLLYFVYLGLFDTPMSNTSARCAPSSGDVFSSGSLKLKHRSTTTATGISGVLIMSCISDLYFWGLRVLRSVPLHSLGSKFYWCWVVVFHTLFTPGSLGEKVGCLHRQAFDILLLPMLLSVTENGLRYWMYRY